MNLRRINLPQNEFDKLSSDVKAILVQSGTIINELSLLQKLIVYSANMTASTSVEFQSRNFIAEILTFYLIGKIKEFRRFSSKHISTSTQLTPLLKDKDSELYKAKRKLDDLLGKSHFINDTRNDFAFHINFKDIKDALETCPLGSDFHIYTSNNTTNDFFPEAFDVIKTTYLKSMKQKYQIESEDLDTQTIDIANLTLEYARRLVIEILTFFKLDYKEDTEFELSITSKVSEPQIPYFSIFEK